MEQKTLGGKARERGIKNRSTRKTMKSLMRSSSTGLTRRATHWWALIVLFQQLKIMKRIKINTKPFWSGCIRANQDCIHGVWGIEINGMRIFNFMHAGETQRSSAPTIRPKWNRISFFTLFCGFLLFTSKSVWNFLKHVPNSIW